MWRHTFLRHRLKLILIAVLLVIVLQLVYYRPKIIEPYLDMAMPAPKEDPEKAKIRNLLVFFDDLEKYAIDAPSLKGNYKTEKAFEKFASNDDFMFNKEYLENVLDISDETQAKMTDSHTRYVNDRINQLLENYGVSTFGANLPSDADWSQYHGSKGYVLVGGGKYSWLSYLVIRQLRALGSELPAELFIPLLTEYEADFCEKVLPKYNARCNVFNDTLGLDLKRRFNLGGFQFKMLALLTLKFEQILYLDSDDFPVRNPDYLFDGTKFKETGLVIWPDAWARTTNPKFFEIAGKPVKERKVRWSKFDEKEAERQGTQLKPLEEYKFTELRFHDFEGALPDPTLETGQLLVDKTRQLKTLLLALYYNVFGPNFYYPIMTQGSAGEGDKETFIAAAHVLGEPYYQTEKGMAWLGYNREDKDGKFDSKALGHWDPDDLAKDDKDSAKLLFMHLSYPKYYPDWLVNNHELVSKKLGKDVRMYPSTYEKIGYDFDLRALQLFTMGACSNYYGDDGKPVDATEGIDSSEFMGPHLAYIAGMERLPEWCEKVFIPHLKWLKSTTEYPDTSVVV